MLTSGATVLAVLASIAVGLPAEATAAPAGIAAAQGITAPGATVQLLAWPKSADTGVKVGGRVPTMLLDTVTAGPSGAFVLRTSGRQLAAAADLQGYVNLEAVAGGKPWFFVRHVSSAGNLTATSEEPATTADINLRGPAPAASPMACGVTYLGQLKPSWAQVGQEYITAAAGNGVSSAFQYFSGQSSSLGIGISATGNAGTFSGDGTDSESSTSGEKFAKVTGASHIWNLTKFRVAKYQEVCTEPGEEQVYHIVRSNGYAAGSKDSHPSAIPSAQECVFQQKGSVLSSENAKAVTWSVGFTTPVFNASAQTGYDHSAEIFYFFKAKGYACGTDHQAPGFAKQVVAEH
jgi:hypothetical protein